MRTDLFEKRFIKVLTEAEGPSLERSAMEASLDSGTDPTDFDVDMEGPDTGPEGDEVADAMSRRNQQIVSELQSWIDKVADFFC